MPLQLRSRLARPAGFALIALVVGLLAACSSAEGDRAGGGDARAGDGLAGEVRLPDEDVRASEDVVEGLDVAPDLPAPPDAPSGTDAERADGTDAVAASDVIPLRDGIEDTSGDVIRPPDDAAPGVDGLAAPDATTAPDGLADDAAPGEDAAPSHDASGGDASGGEDAAVLPDTVAGPDVAADTVAEPDVPGPADIAPDLAPDGSPDVTGDVAGDVAGDVTADVAGDVPPAPDVLVCDEGEIATPDGCVPNGSGERCADARFIEPVDQVIHDTTAQHADDHNAGCQGSTSADLVYAFTLTEEVLFTAEMTGFDTVLSLRSSCAGQTEVACDDDGGADLAARLADVRLAPGTWYLFADGYRYEGGAFDLTLEFRRSLCGPGACPAGMACLMDESWAAVTCVCPAGTVPAGDGCVDDPCLPNPCTEPGRTACTPALPDGFACECAAPSYEEGPDGACVLVDRLAGETCGAAAPLSLAGAPLTRAVGLPDLRNDTQGSCAGAGEEAVFALEVAEPTWLVATASGPDTVLYVRTRCSDAGSELACNDDNDPPGERGSQLGVPLATPGTYYLFVDAWEAADRDATLTLEVRPDPCADGGGCNPDQACERDAEWTTATCVCPSGTVEWEGRCVDDPCQPDPCAAGDHPFCVRLLPGAYECACRPGYVEDDAGACVPDPDGAAWTVMVYLNADNNLEPDGWDDLDEMEVVGSDVSVNVIVELDSVSGRAKRYRVEQGRSTVLQELGEINMGDAEELAEFGEWAIANYPARRYALILWNHGGGWAKAWPPAPAPSWKGFSNDDSHPGSEISIADGAYAGAMERIVAAAGGPLELVGFDACLMGMWEVAHATTPFASWFVGSEETIPTSGWSYDDFLAPLLADPSLDGGALGEHIVRTYQAEMPDNNTLAVVDLTAMEALDAAVSALASALLANPSAFSRVERHMDDLTWYSGEPFTDLHDLATRLAADTSIARPVAAAAGALVARLDESVLLNLTNGSDYRNSHGLSIYLPSWSYDDLYDEGAWSAATTWDDFLRAFMAR